MAYIEDKGVKLWYEITGKGEPLVLTGGFGCLHNQWDWIMDILNEDFSVAYDIEYTEEERAIGIEFARILLPWVAQNPGMTDKQIDWLLSGE